MAEKLKFDIDNENFSHYFQREASIMSSNQKELIPKELLFKVFNRGHIFDSKSTSKLSFLSKLFILFRALRKRIIIIVEDDKEGMDAEEYFKYMYLLRKREYNEKNSEELKLDATFVLGNSELVETFHRINMLSVSPAYNYLIKSKNKDYTKPTEWRQQMNYIMRFVNNYDAMRKTISMRTGLTMADWIVLTYLYDGNEYIGSYLYKEKFKYSYNSSASKIKCAFGSLQTRGLIVKHGNNSGAKFQITPLGIDKVNDICMKYVVNC